MERSIYVAMSGASETWKAQAIHANNIANIPTNGFKADLQQARSVPVYGAIHPSRVFTVTEQPGSNLQPGALNSTNRDLDVAIVNEDGWFNVETESGSRGLTRRGDISIDADGFLKNGSNHFMRGSGGGLIQVPDAEKITIGVDGSVKIKPLNSQPGTEVIIDNLALVSMASNNVTKDTNGLFVAKDGSALAPDPSIRVKTGAVETSNVNAVGELIELIGLARQHELDVKMMKAAEDNDIAAARIMQIS